MGSGGAKMGSGGGISSGLTKIGTFFRCFPAVPRWIKTGTGGGSNRVLGRNGVLGGQIGDPKR